jgi:cardiolipin synthase
MNLASERVADAYAISRLVPLYDQQTEWEYRMRMIEEAQRFLYASTYFIQHDRYGREYVDALLKAHERGVSIHLLIDGFGQILAGNLMTQKEKESIKQALAALTTAGGNVTFYRCATTLQRLLGSGMHIKIQLSERGGALFSSGNISATSYDKWREFSVYVEGPIVGRLMEEFTALGISVDASHTQYLHESIVKTHATGTLRYLSYNPTLDPHPFNPVRLKRPNIITDYFVGAFARATRHIRLTSLYFKPAPVLLRSLIDAANRGVSVEIFHSHRDALGASIVPWIPSFYLYRRLTQAGIAIYENLRGEHSKIILIDDSTAIFGSYNFEYAAHDRLAEAIMISEDKKLLETIGALFSRLRESAENVKVNAAAPDTLPKDGRWKILLSWPFARWL